MNTAGFRLVVFAALFLCSLATQAQVKLTASNVSEEELVPGKSQTVVLSMKNQTNDTLKLRIKMDIPKPMRGLLFRRNVTLLPHQSKPVMIPVSIPRSTDAGNYDLKFSLLMENNSIASTKVKYKISRITEVKVDLIEFPPYARSIDTIRTKFMIVNNGNSREQLTLVSANGAIQGDRIISVPPDSTVYIDMIITNSKRATEVEDQLIDLFANIGGANKSVGDQEIIKVYPIKTVKVDPFFRFPVTMNFNYFTQNTNGEFYNQIFQFQITGNGYLDLNKKHKVNFSYRGPGAVRIARIGDFQQKYISYTNRSTTYFLGEQTFGLSELTENFRFGTGVELKHQIDSTYQVGGYYNRPIFQPEIREQIGGFAAFYTKKKHMIRVNSLNNFHREGGTTNLTSLQVDFTDYTNWRFAAEASRSFSGNQRDGSAFTYNTNLTRNKWRLSSNGMYADNNFGGYYNNSLFAGLNTSYRWDKIGVQANLLYNNANPNLDTIYSVAPITTFASAGILGKLGAGGDYQLVALYREKVDRLSNQNFDYNEQRLRFTYSYKRGRFSSRFLGEAGNTTNNTLALGIQRSFGYDAQLQLIYRPKKNFWFSAFSQYLNNNRFSSETENYLLYGVDANVQWQKKLRMSLEFQNNYLIEDLYNDRNLLNFRMNYAVARNQNISVFANYGILHQAPVRRDWFLQFNYYFRLGVPLVKTAALGTLEGQLVNNGVKSVDNVVLMMSGQLVTTNDKGKFKFENVEPGTHDLYIDKSTVGVRDVPTVPMPIKVEIEAEKTQTINIEMTLSARVRGVVALKKVRTIQSSKKEIRLPLLVIEAVQGDEVHLTQINPKGEFVFGSLRPGTWTFRITGQDKLKGEFVVNTGSQVLELKSGDEGEVNLMIAPKVRRIKFLNTKKIKVGG